MLQDITKNSLGRQYRTKRHHLNNNLQSEFQQGLVTSLFTYSPSIIETISEFLIFC